MPSGNDQEVFETEIEGHWSRKIEQVVLTNEGNCPLNLSIDGGSDNGEFVCVGDRTPPDSSYLMGHLNFGSIVLEIQGQKTAGYTQRDVIAWLNHCCRNGNPVTIKTIPEGSITKDLRQYLTSRFPKGSPDHDLQNTIRDNLYLRTVPCTTRPQRDGEVNGVDYCFLTPEEFMILERSEKLLESGIFEGNHYGTPKPPTENPVYVGAYSHQQLQDLVFLPGAHASSEGKRRRNRSNVEAMSGSRTENKPERHVQSVSSDGMNNQSASLDTLPLVGMNDDLGPLPPQWEKAYTETGEPYFIDHRSGTSHWLDPRLARIRKKTIEDCNDDELPYGWEKIDDPQYGTYYIDHVNRKTQYENPVLQAKSTHQHSTSSNNSLNANDTIGGSNMSITKQSECSDAMKRENTSQSGLSLYLPCLPCVNDTQDKSCSTPPIPITSETGETTKLDANTAVHGQLPGLRAIFSKNPADLQGEFIKTILVKSNRGFGFTIVGGDGETEEYLQIKNIIPNGPAWTDGRLKTGDVVVYVNDICVIGSSHQDIVRLFQSFVPGETVELEVCRGYPLQFDLNNPDNEVITTVAVSSENILSASGTDTNSNFHSANGIQEDGNNSLLELNIYNTGIESIQNNHIKNPSNILEFQPLVPPKPDFLIVHIVKGNNGFGFTIADSAYGQKVKKILDQTRCQNLVEGDILVAINNQHVKDMQHSDVVQVLKNCPQNLEASITIQRGSGISNNKITKSNSEIDGTLLKMNGNHQSTVDINNLVRPSGSMKFRSKTPNPADLYSSHDMEVIVPNRPKTPIVDTRSRSHSSLQYSKRQQMESSHSLNFSKNAGSRNNSISQRKLYEKAPFSDDHFEYDQKFSQNHINSENGLGHSPADISVNRFQTHKDDAPVSFNVEIKRAEPLHSNTFSDNYPDMIYDPQKYGNLVSLGLGNAIPHTSEQNELYRAHHSETNNDPSVNAIETYTSGNGRDDYYMSHGDNGSGYLQDYDTYYDYPMQLLKSDTNYSNEVFHVLSSGNWRKQSTSFEHEQPSPSSLNHFSQEQQGMYNNMLQKSLVNRVVKNVDINVTLKRKETGFGFRIVGGTEDGSQVSIGHIVPGGAADLDGRLKTGDEIISIDGQSVFNTSHHHAVQLMGKAASNGHVNLGVRRTNIEEDIAHLQTSDFSSYDVTVTRKENEGFGFVIISSVSRAGSAIGRIMENSPAERCGQLQIGDRILAVNGTDIMHLHHGEIVNLIKDSGYSVTLTIGLRQDDTCSTSSQSNRPLEKHLEDEQYFSVELTRGTRGFGFSIRGGMEFQNMPLFVLRIADVGPAAQDGRLKIGDQIIEINGVNTKDMTHSTAIEIIKQGGSVVRLLVKRGNKLPLPIEHLVSVATTQDHSPLQSVLSTEYQTHHR